MTSNDNLYRFVKAAPDNLPKEDVCIRFKDGDGVYNYAKSSSFHNILNISDCEWLEKIEADQDAVKKLVNIIINSPDYPSMAVNIENNYFLIPKQ